MEKKGVHIDIEEYEDKERLSLTLMAIGMIMGAMIVIISAILAFGAFVAEGDYGYAIKSVSFLPIPICIFLIGYFRIKRMGRELSASAFEKKNEKELFYYCVGSYLFNRNTVFCFYGCYL